MHSLTSILIPFLTFCLCGFASAQQTFFRNIYDNKNGSYVEVTSLFSKLPARGFAPMRVTIANRLDMPVSVSLFFNSEAGGQYYTGKLKVKSSFAVSCPARTVSAVDLMVPVAASVKDVSYGGHNQMLSVNMAGISQGSYNFSSNNGYRTPFLLMSEALSTPNASALDAETASYIKKKHSHSYGNSVFAGKFQPSMMPEDWRAYAGHDGILMTDQDWLTLSPGARSAILQWNRHGGLVRIFATNSSNNLASLSIAPDPGSARAGRGKGSVKMTPIATSLSLDAPKLVNEIYTTQPYTYQQATEMSADYSGGAWGLQSQLGSKQFHFILFILVLIGFGILVGPVNLFVFAKSGVRHKLFITTPVIALGASLLMIVLIFVQDGLGGQGMRIQWIELAREQSDNNAYIHQEQISRTGVLISNRFELTEPCVIASLPLASSQWSRLTNDSRNDQSYEMNFTDKHLQVSGDWFQSRSEQAQLLQAVVPTRARIEFTDPSNDTSMLSNFDYELDQFFFRSENGKFWRAEKILSGKNFLLSECNEYQFEEFVRTATSGLSSGQKEKVSQLAKRGGYFIATSQHAPMLESYSAIDWKNDLTIITGRVQMPEAP
jgi:hypothetical protein